MKCRYCTEESVGSFYILGLDQIAEELCLFHYIMKEHQPSNKVWVLGNRHFEKMDERIRSENQYGVTIRNFQHVDISLVPPTRSLEEMAEAYESLRRQLDLEKATALEDRIEDELEKQYTTNEIVEISLTEAVPDDILEWLRERYSAWNIVAYDNFLEFRPK